MAKDNQHKAKFYCENCGFEVPQNAKFCNHCGKFFTFVRCPMCQFTGESKKFTNGCPKCGYAVKPYGGIFDKNKYSDSSSVSGNKSSSSTNGNKKKNRGDSSVPVWVLITAVFVLIAVILIFYSCL